MAADNGADVSGCTLAMAIICGNIAYSFYIGDSRIYYRTDGTFIQLSKDHTIVMYKLKTGIYTKKEVSTSPDAHRLTAFLGADPTVTHYEPIKYAIYRRFCYKKQGQYPTIVCKILPFDYN